jgi:hypothetical protein
MNDIAVIHLVKGGFTIVDADLFEELNKRRWYMGGNGYITTYDYDPATQKTKHTYIHRLINATPKGLDTDHANECSIDNTRRNLRSAKRGLNMANCTANHKNKTSSFKGVRRLEYPSGNGAWVAQIRVDYKMIRIGSFPTELEAAQAYNRAATARFGEFARLNDLTNLGRRERYSMRGALSTLP